MIKENYWDVGMTHGITYGYDHFSSRDILWSHLKKVKEMEDEIWLGTFREVAAYIKESDSTILQVRNEGKDRIRAILQA